MFKIQNKFILDFENNELICDGEKISIKTHKVEKPALVCAKIRFEIEPRSFVKYKVKFDRPVSENSCILVEKAGKNDIKEGFAVVENN